MSLSPFWRVPEDWGGHTAVCIAGGMSLTREQVEACRGRAKVVAVNDAYLLAPWADCLYFCDDKWWGWHRNRPEYRAFAGVKVTLENTKTITEPGVRRLRNCGREGFCSEPDGVKTGGNSGFQAIHFVAHRRPRRILLLGYDMRPAPDGRTHWFGDHPQKTWQNVYKNTMLPLFPGIAPELSRRGIEVVNCTPGSALTLWPFKPIHEALLQPHPTAV